VFLVGSMLLIFLVFCVVFLVGSVLLIFLVFCVVFFVFVFVLCLVYLMLAVSIDCPFLIALSVFANVYFGVVCIRYVSCTVEELVTILKHLL
jgi:hypothetical protein